MPDSLKIAVANFVWFLTAVSVCKYSGPFAAPSIGFIVCMSMWWVCIPVAVIAVVYAIRDLRGPKRGQAFLALALTGVTLFGGLFPGT